MMTKRLHDPTGGPPRLKIYMNQGNLADLPADSIWNGRSGEAAWEQLSKDGFEGLQLTGPDPVPAALNLPYCGSARINEPGEAESIFRSHKDRGDICITLHAGWGMEDDDAVDRLLEAILKASGKCGLPAFIETHRATITQDIWRTVRMTERFPEIRFNGDFSHYYCGQEMVYGNFREKLDFMQPIFDRIGFMHGRIASSGNMQIPIEDTVNRPLMAVGEPDYLDHFKQMWIEAMKGFLKGSQTGDYLVFAPELLSSVIYYARVFPDQNGNLREESDRYAQALLYMQVARDCFECAKAAMAQID